MERLAEARFITAAIAAPGRAVARPEMVSTNMIIIFIKTTIFFLLEI